ncbi:MAG: DUF6340 family protein [Flavitalea sp.]
MMTTKKIRTIKKEAAILSVTIATIEKRINKRPTLSLMKKLISLACLPILLFSCRSTQIMSLSVMEPAPIIVPSYIKHVGLVNRSLPEGKAKILDAVDKVFTLEGPNLDKEGSLASLNGLADALMKDNRFEEVRPIKNAGLSNNTPGLFPSPLSWETVEQICRENNTDALFALELFDTDSKIDYNANPIKVNTPVGKVSALEQQVRMGVLVKTGWRIYDPIERNILDEFPITSKIVYSARGINPVIAAAGLIGRKDAVKEVGAKAGQEYAFRIIPYWLRVSRDYYVRGSANFKIAKRKAQTGNWEGAALLWNEETKNASSKIAGRACYNMAIISEINGDVDMAMQWAQRSYENYNNRLALNYSRILKERKASAQELQYQESESIRAKYEQSPAQ